MHSIVDRFLEHSRILVFGEGSKQQVFLSSADWMPRNFERRVEVMFPIESEDLRRRIVDEYHSDLSRRQLAHARICGRMERMLACRPAMGRRTAASTNCCNGLRLATANSAKLRREPLSFDAIADLADGNGEPLADRPKRKKREDSRAVIRSCIESAAEYAERRIQLTRARRTVRVSAAG